MFGYIYLTTNLINNKKYIGQHEAEVFTEDYKGSGRLLKLAFNKYGWSNFKVELLQECDSFEELNQAEKFWISKFNAVTSEEFYNLAYGGKNSPGHPLSDEERLQRSQELKRRWQDQNYRSKIVKMLHDKQKDGKSWMVGKHHSEETKAKMSKSRSGENHPMYGKHYSEEVRHNMSLAAKQRKQPPQCTSDGNPAKGRIWMNNGVESIRIIKEQLQDYENQGWVRGRIINRRTVN